MERKMTKPAASPIDISALPDFGKVQFPVDASYVPDAGASYKVVFSISGASQDDKAPHSALQRVARAVNLYCMSGVPLDHLEFSAVIHGAATTCILADIAYQRRHGIANPNAKIIDALLAVGVELTVCAQAFHGNNIPADERRSGVTLALAALTALPILQQEGYSLMNL
ncbi:hypothetical protein WM40_04290 [Robbsia andropogonis]|uniref:Uncharacterized protein n=2 Tax=Robbsia andropogonis TaxID=28092 RepID=A0A0F5K454_9BURK|nr:hypothetical protein WM40_04290 [Robbsia andropogonis]